MNRLSSFRNGQRRHGVSMLEVVVSLTLVSTILFVSLNASVNVFRNRASSMDGVLAQELAGVLLDEITTMPFRDLDANVEFGPEDDENPSLRSSFDDIDDYRNWTEVSPTYRDGSAIEGYDGWQTDVSVVPFRMVNGILNLTSDSLSTFRLIGVSVTSPGGQVAVFRSMVSATGDDLEEDRSFERIRQLTVGFSGDREIELTVPLRNRPAPAY